MIATNRSGVKLVLSGELAQRFGAAEWQGWGCGVGRRQGLRAAGAAVGLWEVVGEFGVEWCAAVGAQCAADGRWGQAESRLSC